MATRGFLRSKRARNEVVVEVRGGCLVAVYARDPGIRVELVDWDDFADFPPNTFAGGDFPASPFHDMPPDVQAACRRQKGTLER